MSPGDSAIDLAKTFPAKFSNISRYYFKTYAPSPGVEERLDEPVLTLAALSTEQLLERHPDADKLVEQLLRGTGVEEAPTWQEVPISEFSSRFSLLQKECQEHQRALALCSRCLDAGGNEWHIPMMDFRIKSGKDKGQVNLLKKALLKLEQKEGVLLNSGNSYHYYGFQLLTKREWRKFMVKSLLLGPLVDVRYISHRLLAGTAALRLTEALHKPEVPKVEALLP